jgi:hypothetical protein
MAAQISIPRLFCSDAPDGPTIVEDSKVTNSTQIKITWEYDSADLKESELLHYRVYMNDGVRFVMNREDSELLHCRIYMNDGAFTTEST